MHSSSHARYLGPNPRSGTVLAVDAKAAVECLHPVGETAEAGAERGVRAAEPAGAPPHGRAGDAVVAPLEERAVAVAAEADGHTAGLGVFRDVRERLRDDVVGGRLDG